MAKKKKQEKTIPAKLHYTTAAQPRAVTADGVPVFCSHDALISIEEAVPNPRNPNQHSDAQVAALANIIQATGWRQPITISRRSGFVVKGHGRLLAARKKGWKQVPADYQEYANEAEEWADLIADNRLAELSSVDNALLTDLISEIGDSVPLELTGFDQQDVQAILAELDKAADSGDESEDDGADAGTDPAEGEPATQTGDLWIPDSEPWERLPGESVYDYEYFCAYRDMRYTLPDSAEEPPKLELSRPRSLRNLAAQLGKSKQTLGDLSTRFNWQTRCDAYDLYILRRQRDQNELKILRVREKQLLIAEQMMERALRRIFSLGDGEIKALDALRMVESAVKIGQFSSEAELQRRKLEADVALKEKREEYLDVQLKHGFSCMSAEESQMKAELSRMSTEELYALLEKLDEEEEDEEDDET